MYSKVRMVLFSQYLVSGFNFINGFTFIEILHCCCFKCELINCVGLSRASSKRTIVSQMKLLLCFLTTSKHCSICFFLCSFFSGQYTVGLASSSKGLRSPNSDVMCCRNEITSSMFFISGYIDGDLTF